MSNKSSWETPIQFKSFDLPDFPVDELPSIVADYIRELSETTQTSPDMSATAALATLALCLQGKFVAEPLQGWHEPLSLFMAVIAAPGERKSPVENRMLEPVREFERNEIARQKPRLEQSRIEKSILENKRKSLEIKQAKSKDLDYTEISALSKEISEFKEIKPFRMICDDITPEKLANILSENNGKIGVFSSEGGIFDVLAGRYSGSVNIDVFLKAHDGDSITIDRLGRATDVIAKPALTTLIFAQPKVLTELMNNQTFLGCGLCARFLYSLPKSPLGRREYEGTPVSELTKTRYYELIEKLLKFSTDETKIVKVSEKSHEMLKIAFEKIEPMLIEELTEIRDFASKMHGHIVRIATIMYLAENADRLSDNELILEESFVKSARKIMSYFVEHAKAAYSLMVADDVAEQSKKILNYLQKKELRIVSLRDIMRFNQRLKSAEMAMLPINRLCEYGYLRELNTEYENGRGRPQSKIWEVNPMIYNMEIK